MKKNIEITILKENKVTPLINKTVEIELNEFQIASNYEFHAAQNHPAQFETSTPSYSLIDFSVTKKIKGVNCELGCNNLMNTVYFDHLSLYKDYGIYNHGRNIYLNLSITF